MKVDGGDPRTTETFRIDYPYLTRWGEPITKTRIEYADGHKRFVWPKGTKVEDVLLYNHDLLHDPRYADAPVLVVEGEKTANCLVAAGFCAVSFCGGSGQRSLGVAADALAERTVYLWPDSDKPGLDSCCFLREELRKARAKVSVLEPVWGAEKGTDAADLLEGVDDPRQAQEVVLDWFQHTIDLSTPPKVTLHDAADLAVMDFAPAKVIVPTLFNANHYLLSGAPKTGKSFLAMSLATAIATGGHALGTFAVEQRPVLYLALEDGLKRTAYRLKQRLSEGLVLPRGAMTFAFDMPALDEGGQDELFRWLLTHQEGIVFIDTGKRLRMGQQDESSSVYSADYDFIAPLTDMAHQFDTMIMTVWHDRKLAADDFFDAVNSSRGLTAAVDGVAQLQRNRGELRAKLSIGDRDTEDRACTLKWDEHLLGWLWVGSTDVAEKKVNAEDLILTWLGDNESDTGATAEQISEGTGIPLPHTRNSLTALKKAMRVFNNKPTRPGRWFVTVPVN